MNWRFWKKPEPPKPQPQSRISFTVQGAWSCGWYLEDDYLRIHISSAGTVTAINLTIDGFVIHSLPYKPVCVNNGDVICYPVVEFFRNQMRIKDEDQRANAPTLPCS